MSLYECVFIARQDVSASHVESLTDQFAEIITEYGGQVTKREMWGLRSLAYRIKKNRKGHYVLLNLDAPAAALHELERNMRINEDVLRYLSLRLDELEEGPSIVMQSRQGRTDRGGRDGRGAGRGGFRPEFKKPPESDSEAPARRGDGAEKEAEKEADKTDAAPAETAGDTAASDTAASDTAASDTPPSDTEKSE